MPDKCPGSGNIRTPIPSYKECPECGEGKYNRLMESKVKPGLSGFYLYL